LHRSARPLTWGDRKAARNISEARNWPVALGRLNPRPLNNDDGKCGDTLAGGIDKVVMGCYETRPERLAVSSLRAKSTKSLEFMLLWRLSLYETLLKRLTQHLQDMAAARRQLIENEHTMVRQ
jgi:hypothetical protein